MNYETAIAVAEAEVCLKVRRKFDRVEAEDQAKAQHRKDLASWAKVANRALFRQSVYKARKAWAEQVIKLGIVADRAEAFALARLQFPL